MTKVKNYCICRRPCPRCSAKKDDGKERKITEDEGGDCLNRNGHERGGDSKNRWEHMQEELGLREKREADDAEVGVASETDGRGHATGYERATTSRGFSSDERSEFVGQIANDNRLSTS